MDKEQIRNNLMQACTTGALEDILNILNNNLKEDTSFSRIIFEQAVFKCIVSENINALTVLLSQDEHSVSPMSYSYFFDQAAGKRDILQMLCLKLDLQELSLLYFDKSCEDNAFIQECITRRVEKEFVEKHITQSTTESKKFKI